MAIIETAAGAWGLSLSSGARDRIIRHYYLVREANRRVNLVGLRKADERAAFIRLAVDSLSLAAVLSAPGGRAADIGSGGGYPGLVMAALYPSQPWTLIEATGKKADFLRRAKEALSLPLVEVVHARAEAWARSRRETFQWVAARAVGSLALVAELGLPLLEPGGVLVAMRGPEGRRESLTAAPALATLGGAVVGVQDFALPEGQGARCLVQVEKAGDTPARFPRIGGALGRF